MCMYSYCIAIVIISIIIMITSISLPRGRRGRALGSRTRRRRAAGPAGGRGNLLFISYVWFACFVCMFSGSLCVVFMLDACVCALLFCSL